MTVNITDIDTLVVGAGQAGIAMSEHLTHQGVPHIVLEKNRIADSWLTKRWDSLVANGPAWHDRFPGMTFPNSHPDSFVSKDKVAEYFEAYAHKFNAPIKTGVDVLSVTRNEGNVGFIVETSEDTFKAQRIVSATGAFQTPTIPSMAPTNPALYQIHSVNYYNPEQLPKGAVLVVGAGSSGVQIADELNRAGKKVFLSVGPHNRAPRRYRDRDCAWWLGVLGLWDAAAENEPSKEHVTIAVSGAQGGKTIDFRELASQGLNLVGRTNAFDKGTAYFDDTLAENIHAGDNSFLYLLDRADEYVAHHGLDLPEEPEARQFLPDPKCMTTPTMELPLHKADINTVIWATGYTTDYSWLKVNAFDENNQPKHHRGVSSEAGVYFLGLPWLSRRSSSFIWGVWHDAKYIADHIVTQRQYQFYPRHV